MKKSFVTVTPDESSSNKVLRVNCDAYSSADDQEEYIIVSRGGELKLLIWLLIIYGKVIVTIKILFCYYCILYLRSNSYICPYH